MKFCSNCGQAVEHRDSARATICRVTSARPAARSTTRIRKIVAGCVPEYDGRILLCRRAIEPRHGFWTIPAGFMENGETTQEAARRESMEEALAEVEIGSLLAVVHVLHADQVHVMFRARLPRAAFRRRGRKPRGHALRGSRNSRGTTSPFAASTSRCGAISRIAARASRTHHFTTIDLRVKRRSG